MAFQVKTNENGKDTLVHFRHLGEKEDGKEVYKNVSWADVTINGVDLDTTLKNDQACEDALINHKNTMLNHLESHLEVHPRKTSNEILESTSSFKEFKKGDGYKKVYVRQRKVPQGVHKKYPTKPWNQSKQEKMKQALQRVTDELEVDFNEPKGETVEEKVQNLKMSLGEDWWDQVLQEHPELKIDEDQVSSGSIPDTSIVEGWFNYGDELTGIPDQLVFSKDPVTIDGKLMWIFHSMVSGEQFYIKYDATIRDVFKAWNMINSKM